MTVTPPLPEEFAALLSDHAHRFPEKASLTVIGDGDKPVRLPLVLGNPSGACKMPDGQPASDAWRRVVSATFNARASANEQGLTAAMALDSVLWPSRVVWAQWCARWPGLPQALLDPLRSKWGASLSQIAEPAYDDEPPPAVAAVLAASSGAVWRFLRPRGEQLSIAIDPAPAPLWRLFQEALKRGLDVDAKVRELAETRVKACVDAAGAPVPIGEVFDRWPGLTTLVTLVLGQLAGVSAEVALGEW